MKLSTFYNIFYNHRVKKAKLILKIYILSTFPIAYLMNFFFISKVTNLDKLDKTKFQDKSLDYLLEYFGSDKAFKTINQYNKPIKINKEKIISHGYSKYYEKYFEEYKNTQCNILELGSYKGHALAAFYFYFKKSNIYSGDIYPDILRYKSDRIKSFFIDSGSEASIKSKILNLNIEFDIIVEDASHNLRDQILSLFMCFKKLKSKGIYAVEELDFPDTRSDMRDGFTPPTLREILNNIKNNQNFTSAYIKDNEKNYLLENFSKIEIYTGGRGNEIAFIKKK